jgi:ParB family chromosome partitioning protein
MAKTAELEGVTRENIYLMPPEQLTIVRDKAHELYDPRIELPLDPMMVASIRKNGVLQVVLVRKDGAQTQVVDGRRRVLHAIEANKQLVKEGGDSIKVRVRFVRTSDEAGLYRLMFASNAFRLEDKPSMRADKVQRAVDHGCNEDDIAEAWGVTKQTVKNWLSLLDMSSKVKKAVDTGDITETAARELSKTDRAEQDAALEKLIAAGAGRGVGAGAAARAARKTGKVAKKNAAAKKMLPRPRLEGFLEALGDCKESPRVQLTANIVRAVLGDQKALADYPDIASALARVKRDGSVLDQGEA